MLETRSTELEIMDDLSFSGREMDNALEELELVNKWLGGYSVVYEGIEKLTEKEVNKNDIAIADIGCGGGDMLRKLYDWKGGKNPNLTLTGIDANPYVTEFAKKRSNSYPEIQYFTADVFDAQFQNKEYDIMLCSLFCHHFTDEQLIKLFSGLYKQSRLGFIINDLHRHWLAYGGIKLLTTLFSKSGMVKNDGPLSVKRAFNKKELISLLHASGIKNYEIKWCWAFRWQVVVYKVEVRMLKEKETSVICNS